MLDEVRRSIHREELLTPAEPVWVGVSGGVDSMVLLHVLHALGHPCFAAHVDHGLRGAESDGDREMVASYCVLHGIPFRSTSVDVHALAMRPGMSTQMAARELRYAWFHELIAERPIPFALAHHADDAVETLFIDLLRGTGVRGWGSIAPKAGGFVRPLLCVGRAEVMRYAEEHGVPFREDSSNADPTYLRNRIRHELMPLLDRMRPGARAAMARSVALLRDLETSADVPVRTAIAALPTDANGGVPVPFAALTSSGSSLLLLHALLRPRGFHPDTIDRIRDAVQARSTGARFGSADHTVIVDRDALIITKERGPLPAYIIDPDVPQPDGAPFVWSFIPAASLQVPQDMYAVALDADRLVFPLELRPWRPGDRMRPIGLNGSKLISDILTDAKVPAHTRHAVHVLTSGGAPVWLVGHRLAEGVQATTASARVMLLRWHGTE